MRKTGTVKWFNQAKGFGFILPDGGGADVFVHVSALTKAGVQTLGEGQRVAFDLAQDRGKTMAAELQLDGPAPAPQPRGGGGFDGGGGGFKPRGQQGGGFGGRDRDGGGRDGGGRDGGGRGGREGRGPGGPGAGPRPHAGIFDALNMVVIRVRDLAAARGWYERVLELRVSEDNSSGQTVVLDLGRGPNLCLWQIGQGESLPGSDIAAAFPNFRSGDVDGVHAKLEAQNVSVTPLKDSGGVKWFSFYDPDGNRIDVVQNRPRAY